jgi:hypothetical protein
MKRPSFSLIGAYYAFFNAIQHSAQIPVQAR